MNAITSADIRKYTSLQDIADDVHRVRRAFASTVMSYNIPLAQRLQEAFAVTLLRTRGAKPGMVKPPTSKPDVNEKALQKIGRAAAALNELRRQDNMLTNILTNLNAGKFITDVPAVARLKAAATDLQTKVREQIESLMMESSKRGETRASSVLSKLADKVLEFLAGSFKKKGSVKYLDGLIDGEHAIVAYIIFEHVKNDRDEIDPLTGTAITEKDDTFYLNPGVIRVLPPGSYRLEHELASEAGASTTKQVAALFKQCVPIIRNQLIFDKHATRIQPKAVPITHQHVSFDKIATVTNTVFKDDRIEVTFAPKIATRDAAEEEAQEVYKRINNAVLHADMKSRDRIIYVLKKLAKGWTMYVMFTPNDKHKGKTLSQQEEEFLRLKFNDAQISAVKRALGDME